MNKHNHRKEILKYFFKDFWKPFRKLFSTLRTKWKRAIKVARIKSNLIDDLEKIRISMFTGQPWNKSVIPMIESNFDELHKIIDQKTIEEVKIMAFLNKVKTVDRNTEGYEDAINKMFKDFYKKLDRRINRMIIKLESKSIVDSVEYDEESILSNKKYKKQKIELQVELAKLQEWAMDNGKKIAIAFEGRDAAGKGSSIKRFIEYLNPKGFRVVALGIPTKEESNNWFKRYEKHLPKPGEIVFFDRSWYNRAVIEPTMDYCTEEQYQHFMDNVNQWEEDMINDDVILIKFWFSVKQEKQLERFELRKQSPLKHWKYSPNDEKTISKWDVMTMYKEQMFDNTSTAISPWVVIKSNDKRVSRLNSIRYVLSSIDYKGKDETKNIYPSTDIVKIML